MDRIRLVAVEFIGDTEEELQQSVASMFGSEDKFCWQWWIADDKYNGDFLDDMELCAAIFVPQGRSQEAISILCQHGFCVHEFNGVRCPSGSTAAYHLRNIEYLNEQENN
jgi:hypothetical protein